MGIIARFDNFDAQLMPQDSRILKKWLSTRKRMQISAANPDAMHPDQSLARLPDRSGTIGDGK